MNEYNEEAAHYNDAVLNKVMPQLVTASDNSTGAHRSRSGYVFPPFFVLERGLTLRDWGANQRGFFEVTGMLEAVAKMLDVLHCAGRVHRCAASV